MTDSDWEPVLPFVIKLFYPEHIVTNRLVRCNKPLNSAGGNTFQYETDKKGESYV